MSSFRLAIILVLIVYSIKDSLEELLQNHDLTLTQLASNLGIPYKTLSNYYHETFLPNYTNINKLADYFHCSIDYLMGLTDSAKSNGCTPTTNQFLIRYNELLQTNNLTHYRVTKDLGLNINISRKWKNGAIPSLTVLTNLAKYFSVSIDYLIGRTDNKY